MKLINSNTIKWVAGFITLAVAENTILKFISIEITPNLSVQPDLILLLLFFFGLRYSQIHSTLTGFSAGLMFDLISGSIFGLSALTKTVAGFMMGFLPREHKVQKISHFILMLFTIVFAHDLIFNAVYVINTEINYWRLILLHALPSSLYTVFIGGIIFYWKKH